MINFKDIFYSPNRLKPLWKWRFITMGIGFVLGWLISLVIKNPGFIFLTMFIADFVYFFFRAKRLKLRFNYCYFGMVVIGCAIYLMLV